jgi:exonuclease SbcD
VLMDVLDEQVKGLEADVPSILAAHIYVFGARVGSEKGMTLGWEHFLLPGNLANLGFDYIALGHIHKHQVLNDYPPIVYSGSLERIDFSEETEDKGFCVIQIEAKGKVSWEFHKLPARPFCTIKVSINDRETDPTGAVLRAIARAGQRTNQAVVRLIINIPEHMVVHLQDGEIRQALGEAYFVNISKEIERQQRSRLGTIAVEKLSPMEALRAYLEVSKVSSERSRKLLEYGEKLISGQQEE